MKKLQNFIKNQNISFKKILFLTTCILIVLGVLAYKVDIAYSAQKCGCGCDVEGCSDEGSQACERIDCKCGCSICSDYCINEKPPCDGVLPCSNDGCGGGESCECPDFCTNPDEVPLCGKETYKCDCSDICSCDKICLTAYKNNPKTSIPCSNKTKKCKDSGCQGKHCNCPPICANDSKDKFACGGELYDCSTDGCGCDQCGGDKSVCKLSPFKPCYTPCPCKPTESGNCIPADYVCAGGKTGFCEAGGCKTEMCDEVNYCFCLSESALIKIEESCLCNPVSACQCK